VRARRVLASIFPSLWGFTFFMYRRATAEASNDGRCLSRLSLSLTVLCRKSGSLTDREMK